MGHVILYEEGGIKARELEKKQAEEKARVLAEERRTKWWLKMPPPMTLYIRGFEPIVQQIEELATRVNLFNAEDDQDFSFIFNVLKRLHMLEGHVLDWAFYPDVWYPDPWGGDKPLRSLPRAFF
jgi:hypothetical protein